MTITEKITDFINKLDEKNRYSILAGIMIGIFALDYFLIMKGQLDNLNNLNPKINILIQDLNTAKQNVTNIATYSTQVKSLNEQFDGASLKVVSQEELPRVLESISRLAQDSKIKINQLFPIKGSQELLLTNNEGKYYSFPILVEATGGFHEVGRFVDQMEKDEILKSVTALTIAAGPQEATRLTIKLTIKTVVLEPKEAEGGKS